MITLEVHNFQSIEHEKICIDGFTALVGRSNIGKSALVRAVKSALTGAVGTAFVRHGAGCIRRVKNSKTCECYCSVHLVTEGFDLLWEKGDKRNRYVFNGQDYGVPNRGTPDFLQRPLLPSDFGMVQVGDQSELLQIADQFDTIFLLNQSGNVTADVFSDVARLDRVNVAIRFVEKDRKEAASTRKVRDADIITYGRQLTAYDSLDRDALGVNVAERGLGEIEDAVRRADSLVKYIEDLKVIGYRVDQLEQVFKIEVPNPKPLAEGAQRHVKISRFVQAAGERAAVVKRLMGVETIPEPIVGPVLSASKTHQTLVGWVAKLQSLQETFNKYRGVAEVVIPDTTPIRSSYDRAAEVLSLTLKYEVLTITIDRLEHAQNAIDAEVQKLQVEKAALDEYMCPTCRQPMPGHTHERNGDAELRLPN